ncbi:VOC family protein [Streptomyces sp. enrichment culture]|uniref:VOC family protein n=1 Tax=Streptomyces sp. enrichment culture TaxID=1795815 RepID=UPI003F57B2F0
MPLHRIEQLTLGVPDVAAATVFYEDFGLHRSHTPPGPSADRGVVFSTTDGGDQLRLVHSSRRRLLEATFAADDPGDVARIRRRLHHLSFPVHVPTTGSGSQAECVAVEPATGVRVRVVVRPRLVQPSMPAPAYNSRGHTPRTAQRADGLLRRERVRPRRLGHFVLGTTDFETTHRFFTDGMEFKVSDIVKNVGVFLRCSTDHHNLLVQRAPVPFLHHTSWQVDDVDEIGRGAMNMLETDPGRHVWGLGRHYAGSNFFWYLKDPAGNFAEYHSDMDCIPEDALWTPEELEGARGLFQWGPPPPPSFIHPEDLASMMIDSHP